jgi:uncharacterized protein YhaN
MNPVEEQADDDELLTSYLDGELDSVERSQLQQRLMDDAKLRNRLAELQRAWDLLDELPDTPVNQEFTKSTLELVVQRAAAEDGLSDKDSQPSPWRTYRTWAILFALCAIIGFASGMVAQWRTNRIEKRQLVAAAGLPGFKIIDSLEGAREFASLEALDLAAEHIEVLKSRLLYGIPKRADQRPQWVHELSPKQQAILWSQWQEMERLAPSDAQRIQGLATQVQNDAESELLQKAIAVAGAIYENQSDEERQSLRLLSSKDRLARLKTLLYLYVRDWHAENLSESDRKLFSEFVQGKDWRESMRVLRALTMGQIIPDQLFGPGDTLVNELEGLASRMSPELQRCLAGLNENDQRVALLSWLAATFTNARNVSLQEMAAAYNELDASRRERAELAKFSESEAAIKDIVRRQRVLNNPRPAAGGRAGGAPARNRQRE